MNVPKQAGFVVAIYLNSRGFAFVVFEGELAPLDWGIVEVRGGTKHERILARVDRLFRQYDPHIVVLQKLLQSEVQRPVSIRRLNEAIAELATHRKARVSLVSRPEIRKQFFYLGCVSRDAIATAIAKHIPVFVRYLPRPRKPWKSEDASMAIFDAAALALTLFSMGHEERPDA